MTIIAKMWASEQHGLVAGHGFLKVKDLFGAVANRPGKIDGLAGFAGQSINFPTCSPPQEWGGAGGGVDGSDFEKAIGCRLRTGDTSHRRGVECEQGRERAWLPQPAGPHWVARNLRHLEGS